MFPLSYTWLKNIWEGEGKMATSPSVSTRMNERTWRPKIAGILSIIAGVIGLIISPLLIAYGSIAMLDIAFGEWWGFYLFQAGFLLIIAGIIAIAGGIFSLIRKKWWMALAGSISAIICFLFLGIPAVIFVTQSKREFV
jgi:hypothetical protein